MVGKKVMLLIICFFSTLSACSSEQEQSKVEVNMTQKQEKPAIQKQENVSESSIETQVNKAEVFIDLNGKVGAGILFDNNGNMFVARDGELDKITPGGKLTTFCSFKDLTEGKNYFFNSPLIWDMTFDDQGNILAAAQDRILKISPEGKISTLIRKDFQGFIGASGIELDNQGNLYITNGSKIERYTPDLRKSTFIDGKRGQFSYETFISLEFDSDYKNLYVSDFNSKSLLKYRIDFEGKADDNPVVIIKNPIKGSGSFGAPLNIVFSQNGNMYVSIDGMLQIMKVDAEGTIDFLKLGVIAANHMISFGGEGFDEESIYFTTFDGKHVYKYMVGEKKQNAGH